MDKPQQRETDDAFRWFGLSLREGVPVRERGWRTAGVLRAQV
jgi:hypothetical protein